LEGPKFTLGGPAPPRRPLATHPQVLAYNCTTVKFQRHSSVNVRLTEGSLYNMFRIKTSPKMGFWGDIGGRCKDIWWESTFVLRHRWSRSDTTRVVALCMGIAICHRRKFGQVCGFPAPFTEVAENLRYWKASLWIGPSTTTWENRNHSAM